MLNPGRNFKQLCIRMRTLRSHFSPATVKKADCFGLFLQSELPTRRSSYTASSRCGKADLRSAFSANPSARKRCVLSPNPCPRKRCVLSPDPCPRKRRVLSPNPCPRKRCVLSPNPCPRKRRVLHSNSRIFGLYGSHCCAVHPDSRTRHRCVFGLYKDT